MGPLILFTTRCCLYDRQCPNQSLSSIRITWGALHWLKDREERGLHFFQWRVTFTRTMYPLFQLLYRTHFDRSSFFLLCRREVKYLHVNFLNHMSCTYLYRHRQLWRSSWHGCWESLFLSAGSTDSGLPPSNACGDMGKPYCYRTNRNWVF